MLKNNSTLKPKRQKTVFSLDAPQAKEVFKAGDYNDWTAKKHPMKKGRWGLEKKHFIVPRQLRIQTFR